MPLSTEHYVIAALVALVVAALAASVLGVWQRHRAEARAGMDALCAFKWRDYAHLVEDLLVERGFKRAGGERKPGDGGFDLLMERGKSRYLVDCKNGGAREVTEKDVRDLATVMQMQGAEGAVYATTGSASPQVLRLAASRRIEILAGEELWRQARPWVPHDVRDDVQEDARAERNRLGLYALAAGAVAGLAAVFVVPWLQAGMVDMAASRHEAGIAAPAETPVAAGERTMPLPPNLTQEQADARRATAALEVRALPAVLNAAWSTRSTLVVTLKPGVTMANDLPAEMCERILQFEELRYIRMQIETPAEGGDGAPTGRVRWRQCR